VTINRELQNGILGRPNKDANGIEAGGAAPPFSAIEGA